METNNFNTELKSVSLWFEGFPPTQTTKAQIALVSLSHCYRWKKERCDFEVFNDDAALKRWLVCSYRAFGWSYRSCLVMVWVASVWLLVIPLIRQSPAWLTLFLRNWLTVKMPLLPWQEDNEAVIDATSPGTTPKSCWCSNRVVAEIEAALQVQEDLLQPGTCTNEYWT